jgi:hypothetical protein
MELDSVAKCRRAFYRLVGTTDDDAALTDLGESDTEVVDLSLTRGCRAAQRWMLKTGYTGWRQRSSALTWTGTDATTGGQYASLPADFLRAYGSERVSALREANGDPWGMEIHPRDDFRHGDFYYYRGEEIWLARGASPPTTVYLDYHYQHPSWDDDVTIDFPVEARPLIIAEAANLAKEENWLPGARDMEMKIERALRRAREEAQDIARPSKQPRTLQKALRFGNRW